MKTAYIIGGLVLAAGLATGLMTWSRMPWVKAWRKRRDEDRILRPPRYPSPRDMAKFYKGSIPRHEDCSLLFREKAEFAAVVAGYDYQAAPEPDYRRQP